MLLPVLLVAQDKVVESSGKMPAWAKNLAEPQHIISMGTGATLSDAQQQALLLVKQEIVRGVAEKVVATSSLSTEDYGSEVASTYRQSLTTKAAKVPYVQGISSSRIAEFYWEKLQKKSDKKLYFRYYVKYPFSTAQQGKLLAEFREREAQRAEQIAQLSAGVDSVSSVEAIGAALSELSLLREADPDDREPVAVAARYTALYSRIVVADEGSTLGEIRYSLRLGERLIRCAAKPHVQAGCTTITDMRIGSSINTLLYTYDGCYRDEENFVEVRYTFGGVSVRAKIFLKF
jgi:hypothetical protein